MALNNYRIWHHKGKGEVQYWQKKDMDEVVKWIMEEKPVVCIDWGIEKFDSTQNIWVDAFYSDDLLALYEAIRYYFLA